MKKIITILLISLIMNCLLIGVISALNYSERIEVLRDSTVKMYFNGHKLSLRDSNTGEIYTPIIYKNRTYIPVRAFLNVVGVDVDWDEDNNIVLFETEYDIKTGQKNRELGDWYKEQYYNKFIEENENKEEIIETVYYSLDSELINIPRNSNIIVSNKENVISGTEWLGSGKEYLREYIYISEPLILKEKQKNYGHDLEQFFQDLQVVLREQGFSLLEETIDNEIIQKKYVKADMNLYVTKNTDNITLKIIKGTIVDR